MNENKYDSNVLLPVPTDTIYDEFGTRSQTTDEISHTSIDDNGWEKIFDVSDEYQSEENNPSIPELLGEKKPETITPPEALMETSEKPIPKKQNALFVLFVDTEREKIALTKRLGNSICVYLVSDAENSVRVGEIADCNLSAVHIADNTKESFDNGKTWEYMIGKTLHQNNQNNQTIPTHRIDVSCVNKELRHGKTVIDLCNSYTESSLLFAFLEKAVKESIEREENGFSLTLSIEDLAERGDEPGNFPVGSFPPPICDFILSLQRYMQHEKPDMCAVWTLGLLSGASMKRFVATHPANGYQYHPNLYVYFMAESSGRKSSAIKFLSAPYMEYQEELMKSAQRDRSKASLHLKNINAKLNALEKEYGDVEANDCDMDRDDEYADLCEKKQEYEHICESDWDIFLPHGNITIQAIPERLYQNHGMMTLISGEDTIIQKLLRFENDKTEVDIFLDGKDANSFGKERVVSGKLIIKQPLISLIIGGQSKYFKEFVSSEVMKNKGLTARFLFAGMNRKKVARNESDTYRIPTEIADSYRNHISRRLHELPILEDYSELIKAVIPWSDDAKRLVIDYLQKNVADEELEGKLFAGDNDWSGKQEQAACSIIAILHVDWCLYRNESPFKKPISADTAQKGINIHYWFLQEFRYWVMHVSLMTERLADVLNSIQSLFKKSDGKLKKKESDLISPSEVIQHITIRKRPTGKGATKSIQETMESLSELGYLKQNEQKPKLFQVNPYLLR